tara:strand:- start:7473 stop:8093 length:621 start_codon:yes stop_codon:yes gene_type:complete
MTNRISDHLDHSEEARNEWLDFVSQDDEDTKESPETEEQMKYKLELKTKKIDINVGDIDELEESRVSNREQGEGANRGNGDGIPGDFNGDGKVNGQDFGLLLAGWGQDGVGDLNGDGVIDGQDLGLFLALWGSREAKIPLDDLDLSAVPEEDLKEVIDTLVKEGIIDPDDSGIGPAFGYAGGPSLGGSPGGGVGGGGGGGTGTGGG